MKGEKENKNEKDAYNLNSCNNNTVNLNNANIGADISNVNNTANKITKFPDEILEKDIKILIKYILFQKELKGAIKCSKISFKYFPNCYLTNIILWCKYKSHFFYEKLNNIIEDKTKNNPKPINNKSINLNETLINDIFSSIKLLIQNSDSKYESHSNKIIQALDDQKKFGIIFHNYSFIKYPTNFEIIDEFIYEDLLKRNDKIYENNYLKCDIIINYENLIIKYDLDENKQNQIFQLLIGNFENGIFNLKYIIRFTEEKIRQNIFDNFLKDNYSNIMEKNQPYFLETKLKINGNEKIIEFNNSSTNFEEKYLGNKMVKLFLLMYLFDEEIEQFLKKEIKNNGTKYYYLINKKWIKLYKEYYEYKKLCSYFDKMNKNKSFSYNDLFVYVKNNKQDKVNKIIYQYSKNIPTDFLKRIEEKKIDQSELIIKLCDIPFVNKVHFTIGDKKGFNYLGENELIDNITFDLLNQLETNNITTLIKSQSEKIRCLIGENKLFITSEYIDKINQNKVYYFLNIGHIQKCIFTPILLIYLYDRDQFYNIIKDLIDNSFKKFIERYNKLLVKSSCDIENNNNNQDKKSLGKICIINNFSEDIKNIIKNANIINLDSIKLLKLIIYFQKFEKTIKFAIKNNPERLGYLVKTDFLKDVQKYKNYEIIDSYIRKNNNIQNIINNNINESIENLGLLIQGKLDTETIKLINKNKEVVNIKSSSYDVILNKIILDKNKYITYVNKFILLSEEIYNLFKGWTFVETPSFNYLPGEGKIFLINDFQNTILVYNFKNNIELNLEIILEFDQNKNSILSQIKENSFNKFLNYLLFDNDLFSPIFDQNQNKIGTAYKYPPKSQMGYINDYIYFPMRKIIVLYLNYKLLRKQNNNLFNDYYLVNKNWIRIYKDYFEFDKIYQEIEKNNFLNNLIGAINGKDKNFISDKKLTLILKRFSKDLIKDFEIKENNFESNYKNSESKIPQLFVLEYSDEMSLINSLFYYDNFEIISSEIYKYLFDRIDTELNIEQSIIFKRSIENKGEKVCCLFDNNRIIIKFIDNQNSDKKSKLYIGKLNDQFTFEIECFLLYDNKSLMNEHIQVMLNSKGFNDFCEVFMNLPINITILKIDNKKYGLAVKKIQNPDWDFKCNDTNLIIKCFKWPPNFGLDNIGAPPYMNAILQCFCQIKEFVSFFKYNSIINLIQNNYQLEEKNNLSTSFEKLINEMWPSDAMYKQISKGHFSPNKFLQEINKMEPSLYNYKEYDMKDFIYFIITTLNAELNIENNKSKENNNINPNNIINNSKNEFNSFNEDYKRKFNNIIGELFYAIKQIKIQCLNCGNIQNILETYNFLVFHLDEVKNYAIKQINNS